jgi:hypothetical protein
MSIKLILELAGIIRMLLPLAAPSKAKNSPG